ncbi:MAG: fibronectin type III domain-containing protein [Bacteroidales bacterium]|nr:fibronectin type III domain-containing protein [Bacteroidales bacterium]
MRKIPYIIMTLALVAACGGTGTEKQQEEIKVPAVPVNLKFHSATETSLTFQWSAVEGATGYDWIIFKGTEQVNQGSAANRNAKVEGLEKGTTYSFSVRAKNSAGASDYCSPVEGKTEGTQEGGGEEKPTIDPAKYALFDIPEVEDQDKAPRAFPGAEGGGMYTTGGRGGKVLHVTTLEDNSSEGSLRWACTQNYPRIIVFDVAGIISLKSVLQVTGNDCTIAGQTAPGDGICLRNYTFRISASNVIVRFIRCRMGDEAKTDDDAMQVLSHDDDKYKNIIIDHCSISWCTDECASFYGMKDFTFSWNIVSESLRNSVHDKGAHGYGGIWGGNNATYHHNLLAHHDSRNPRLDHDYVSTQRGPVSIVNNVVYNWKGNSCYGGESSMGGYRAYNFVGNYYKPGPATPSNHVWLIDPMVSCSYCSGLNGAGAIEPGHFYMTGNYLHGKSGVNSDNWTGTTAASSTIAKIKATEPFQGNYLSFQTAENAFASVLDYAGASFVRDDVDARIARETKDGTYTYEGSATKDKNGNALSSDKLSRKGLIDTQSDVGGWPEYKYDENIRDSDSDGMPDWFEDLFGLDKNVNDASAKNLDIYGRYTNLEMYLHYLVKDIVNGGNANGTYTQL